MRDPLLSVKIRDAVIQLIQGLNLPGVAAKNVVAKLVEEKTTGARPGVLVTSQGMQEQILPGTTENQDSVWPFRLVVVDTQGGLLDANDPKYRQWRKMLGDAFSPPAGKVALKAIVPAVYRTEISLDAAAFELNAYLTVANSLVLKVWAREPQ